MSNETKTPNYRIYDQTGSHVTKDIYATDLDDAIEQGCKWMLDGAWASEDGVIRKGVELAACVREIVRKATEPDVVVSGWDLWQPEYDEELRRWVVDVSDQPVDDVTAIIVALQTHTGGQWEHDAGGERILWAPPSDWPSNDETDDQQESDCSASHSDDEPDCESEGPGDDDGGHDWRSPYSLVGGLRDNPGVWSAGGTVTVTRTVCACCGQYRTERDLGCQRNAGDPESVVEYSAADTASQEWLVSIHDEDGWLPDWLATQLDRPPTTRYTEEEARKYVEHHTDDDQLDSDDLEHVFAALYGRRADDQDRQEGLWSQCCAYVQ